MVLPPSAPPTTQDHRVTGQSQNAPPVGSKDTPPRIARNYIAGRFLDAGTPFPNLSPVDGSLVGEVLAADAGMVDAAVSAAQAAVDGEWGKMAPAERFRLLRAVADGIEQRFDDFVAAEMADTGKSLVQARTIDIPRGAANFRAFAELAQARAGECFHTHTADGQRALNYTVHRPLGVVAVISPWNLPLLLLTWKVAPALASGNAVIAKPSEETPSTATLLADVIDRVGLPPGAFNLLHGGGPGATGEFLCTHPGIAGVSFTGESRTGSAIMKSAAPTVKKLCFELGGKNAALVFADADFEAAAAGVARSAFTNGGQVCMCTERVYVERPIFEAFVARVAEHAQALRLGWPADSDTDMGPMISAVHRDKVLGAYAQARADGAAFVCGGGAPNFGDARDAGAWVEPTVITGLPQHAQALREEIFGPVCHIAPFDTEDEAVALANDSEYGLAGVVWTTNLSRAHRVAERVQAGMVWVNCWYLRDLRTPFGGVKLSGFGREGGMHSLDFFAEPSTICIKL
jgi:aminomuconate-semialdehyde/2-hydroxymuconate-6-semialdehyde dehydrogenase